MLLGTYTKGGSSILLEFSTEIHQKPGHDKAYPCFAHISCSTLWKPAKIGIVGKLRSRRIQRRRLQKFWIRTRRGRRDLPGNNQGGLDKEYWHFPFLEAPFLVLLRSHSSLSSRTFPMVFGMILEWKTGFGQCTFKGKVCFSLEQVSMVVSCKTETGDGSKGSGALYVSGFDGSFPYILAGEFVCTQSKLLSIEKLPLLLLL